MRNTLRTAVLPEPFPVYTQPTVLRKRQQQRERIANLCSSAGLSKLSGLPKPIMNGSNDDQVLELMVKLQLDLDDEKREEEARVMRYRPYIPEFEIDDIVEEEEEAAPEPKSGGISGFLARQSWPLRRKDGTKGGIQQLEKLPIVVPEGHNQVGQLRPVVGSPLFQATTPLSSTAPRQTTRIIPVSRFAEQELDDEEAVIPEDHLEKLTVTGIASNVSSGGKIVNSTTSRTKGSSLEDTIDKFIESQELSLKVQPGAKEAENGFESGTLAAKMRRETEPSLPSERGRMQSTASKSSSGVDSSRASTRGKLSLPHIESPWAEDFEFIPGRFVEEAMDEEEKSHDSNEKVSIWTKIPGLSRKRSLSRKRADAQKYVATRIPGAAQ